MFMLYLIYKSFSGVYDQDAPESLLLSRPYLYRLGRLSLVYKSYSFWITTADSLFQSVVIFFIAVAVSNFSHCPFNNLEFLFSNGFCL